MKHLTDEERLAVLEGCASQEANDHAKQCAGCAAEIQSLRRVTERLENFEWPARAPRRGNTFAPVVKWALAAGIALCFGFGIGRLSGPSSAEIHASVKAELSRELQQQLRAELSAVPQPKVDSNAILTVLNELRDQQAANYLLLRKDLETLARTADARLQSTRYDIARLELAANVHPAKETIQ